MLTLKQKIENNPHKYIYLPQCVINKCKIPNNSNYILAHRADSVIRALTRIEDIITSIEHENGNIEIHGKFKQYDYIFYFDYIG